MKNASKVVWAGVATMGVAGVSLAGPGSAPETFDETVPDCLVSQAGLAHRALGELVFQGLPSEQQALIAAAGAIGPRADAPAGLGVLVERAGERDWGDAASWIDEDTIAIMRPEHVEMFRSWAAIAAAGGDVPHMCLAPDTDPKVAEAFHAFFEGIRGGEERYQYGTRWSRTALSGNGLSQGDPTTITYSYAPDGTTIPNLFGNPSNSNLQGWLNGLYGSQVWPGLFDQVFARWSFLTGLDYVYEPNDDGRAFSSATTSQGEAGVRGDVRIGATNLDGGGGVLAFNYFPNYGDMVIDSNDSFFNSTTQNYRRFKNTVSHEHGHGIGAEHVCPTNGTKLMEPFINLNFVGPQLDDILFGQRGYGDPLENNDTQATGTDLGALNDGASASYNDISIDDNDDNDYFVFTTSQPVEITVSLTPSASSFIQGPQNSNGSCSPGTQTNYQTVHDLSIEFLDASGNSLGVFNNSAAGVVETASIELFDSGAYAIRVFGDNTNNIQLYDLDVSSVLTLEPLGIDFVTVPNLEIDPDSAPVVGVLLTLGDDSIVGDPELFYSVDGAPEASVTMTDLGAGAYEGLLPVIPCGSVVTYRVVAEGDLAGVVELGPNTSVASLGVARVVTASDDFETDQGWSVSGTIASSFFGLWERGVPSSNTANTPPADADGSGSAWVTGNVDGLSHVSGGTTILTSPAFDLSATANPELKLATWFDDDQGLNPGANVLLLEISDDGGLNWQTLDVLGPNNADSVGGWIDRSYRVRDFVGLTNAVRVRAVASDANGSNLYEAGIDAFAIEDVDCDAGDCPADITGDGVLDNGDIGAFVTAFLAGDPSTDFTGDGVLDNGDIGAFVVAFLAGCP
ncbi:MAG: GC-type dockerin domain-anchored protein [Phycisphaerales bacterium JB040]